MTEADFIAEAKRRGYPKEQVFERWKALKEAGAFSDSPRPGLLPVKPQEITPEERKQLEAELRAWQRQNARQTFSF